ncbi:hypothetical protein E2562_023205 [Oryza meyeriana var. granulata]|uniref:Secreted protein n=1 Tax=Oryza meyeriana var. granulata TaxID=110450 RepID=A0A6G1BZ55_9ORYZ|nr:hypothetical protein E2562_023205 [Oryza meyeriana var. granulata]
MGHNAARQLSLHMSLLLVFHPCFLLPLSGANAVVASVRKINLTEMCSASRPVFAFSASALKAEAVAQHHHRLRIALNATAVHVGKAPEALIGAGLRDDAILRRRLLTACHRRT